MQHVAMAKLLHIESQALLRNKAPSMMPNGIDPYFPVCSLPSRQVNSIVYACLQLVDPEVEMIDPADWDVVCDVRTPDEFEEDCLIGAINTPVLSNEQRAQVGTIYKQM